MAEVLSVCVCVFVRGCMLAQGACAERISYDLTLV